jgi:uncharacterized glyoxalase superfamily protein PhnB
VTINRSMPPGVVIPVHAYPDVREAAGWLCRAFGFVERLRIGGHRAQLSFGDGAVVVTGLPGDPGASPGEDGALFRQSVMVRVADVDSHHEQARRCGARIIGPPADQPYGERQYSAEDPGGHRWTFSQTIADVDPGTWGGVLVQPA